jgi:hypothetical protein
VQALALSEAREPYRLVFLAVRVVVVVLLLPVRAALGHQVKEVTEVMLFLPPAIIKAAVAVGRALLVLMLLLRLLVMVVQV